MKNATQADISNLSTKQLKMLIAIGNESGNDTVSFPQRDNFNEWGASGPISLEELHGPTDLIPVRSYHPPIDWDNDIGKARKIAALERMRDYWLDRAAELEAREREENLVNDTLDIVRQW